MFHNFFKLDENNTTVKTEIVAGLTTFMTMAYIIFVNPAIFKNAGVPFEPTVITTCLAAGITTILMGILTNYPFALAAGMGLNAFLAYSVILGMNVPWQTAMGMVFIEGVIITILVLTKVRVAVMQSIPLNLKRAIGAGIGLLLVFVGLKDGGFVVANPDTFVTLGNLKNPEVILSMIGLAVMIFLVAKKIKGALLIGIISTTIIGFFILDGGNSITKMPPSFFTNFSGDAFSTIGKADIIGAFKFGFAAVIFSFLITDFFDTMGSVILISEKAGYLDKNSNLPRLNRVLLVDSLGAVLGGLFCASSATTYIESAAGVSEGGRTGLTSLVTGTLFLLSIFIAPVVGIVPQQAVSPALIVIGFLMMTIMLEISLSSFEDGFPAFLTLVIIPFTFNISNGIGVGFIIYTLIKLISGKYKEVHPFMYIASVVFIIDFILKS